MIQNFIDTLSLELTSGKGGDGIVSFRREKFIPKGGPDGGDGGDGGDITLVAKKNRSNLLHLKSKRIVKSGDGQKGGPSRLTGARGKPVIIEVPLGTVVKTITNIPIHDFSTADEPFKILAGGKGGRGNYHFRNSINKAPRIAEKGTSGKEIKVLLELKLIADVGIVGFPNAGKSTLLTVLTRANPKTANYPFTTLNPNLGIFAVDHNHHIVLADIPGIIEGAHQGKGLGLDFLRHIERTTSLICLIDCSTQDPSPAETFDILKTEMYTHNEAIRQKPMLVLLSKCELLSGLGLEKSDIVKSFPKAYQDKLAFISSFTHEGLGHIKNFLESTIVSPEQSSH